MWALDDKIIPLFNSLDAKNRKLGTVLDPAWTSWAQHFMFMFVFNLNNTLITLI